MAKPSLSESSPKESRPMSEDRGSNSPSVELAKRDPGLSFSRGTTPSPQFRAARHIEGFETACHARSRCASTLETRCFRGASERALGESVMMTTRARMQALIDTFTGEPPLVREIAAWLAFSGEVWELMDDDDDDEDDAYMDALRNDGRKRPTMRSRVVTISALPWQRWRNPTDGQRYAPFRHCGMEQVPRLRLP